MLVLVGRHHSIEPLRLLLFLDGTTRDKTLSKRRKNHTLPCYQSFNPLSPQHPWLRIKINANAEQALRLPKHKKRAQALSIKIREIQGVVEETPTTERSASFAPLDTSRETLVFGGLAAESAVRCDRH